MMTKPPTIVPRPSTSDPAPAADEPETVSVAQIVMRKDVRPAVVRGKTFGEAVEDERASGKTYLFQDYIQGVDEPEPEPEPKPEKPAVPWLLIGGGVLALWFLLR